MSQPRKPQSELPVSSDCFFRNEIVLNTRFFSVGIDNGMNDAECGGMKDKAIRRPSGKLPPKKMFHTIQLRIGRGRRPLWCELYPKLNHVCRCIVDNVYNEILISAKDCHLK
jgi:hypothetical protein